MSAKTRGLDIDSVPTNPGPSGKNYLFCIGIDQYPEPWSKLKSAVKDARDITKVLTSNYQFDSQYTHVLYDEKATKEAVFAKLIELEETLNENDNLVIYFSGHGYFDKKREITYWIPSDPKPNQPISWINTKDIISYLKPIKSFHIFLMIDSCFSGTLFQFRAATPKGENYKSRTALASGREEEVMDSLEGGNSPFAQGILEVLEGNTDQYIRASQLADKVKEFLEHHQIGQSPVDGRILTKPHDENGDFIFHLRISEVEAWAKAVETGTASRYKNFMDHFPKSKHSAEAMEAYKWLGAKEESTISKLQEYLNQYPGGKYYTLAYTLLSQLEEEQLWKVTTAKDTLSAYFNYLHKFPDGKYQQKAQQKTHRMNEDDEDRAWELALKTNTEQAYQQYLARAGVKKYDTQAKEKLASFTTRGRGVIDDEDHVWRNAQEQNTYLAYLDFIERYPQSNHLSDAQKKMTHLDDLAFNQIKMAESSARLKIKQKVAKCFQYFDEYPGAANNSYVKKIKDRLQIAEIKSMQRNQR